MSEIKNHTKSINQVTEQVSCIDQKQQDMAELQRRFQSRLDNMEEEMKDLRAGRSVSTVLGTLVRCLSIWIGGENSGSEESKCFSMRASSVPKTTP